MFNLFRLSRTRPFLEWLRDAAIAKTVVALARRLGLGGIAEGVETEAQRDFLASSGCRAYQGYFFSRPLPIAGFGEYVLRTRLQACLNDVEEPDRSSGRRQRSLWQRPTAAMRSAPNYLR